jgi:cysteine synthase A
VLADEMQRAGQRGSIVTLLCDGGERYAHTYFDDAWVRAQGLDLDPYTHTLDRFAETGVWTPASGVTGAR